MASRYRVVRQGQDWVVVDGEDGGRVVYQTPNLGWARRWAHIRNLAWNRRVT